VHVVGDAVLSAPGAPKSRLKRLHIRIALNDLDKKFSNFNLIYQHGLLVVSETEGAGRLLAPVGMTIDATARRLPNDALLRALLDAVEASVTDPKLEETLLDDRVEAALLAAEREPLRPRAGGSAMIARTSPRDAPASSQQEPP